MRGEWRLEGGKEERRDGNLEMARTKKEST